MRVWPWLALVSACSSSPGIEVVEVVQTELVHHVEVSGVLEAVDVTPVRPPPVDQWQFRIIYLVEEGTEVAKGDRVVVFDPSEVTKQLEEARLEVARAETEIQEQQSKVKLRRETDRLKLRENKTELSKLDLKLSATEDRSMVEIEILRLDRQMAKVRVEHQKEKLALLARSDEASMADLRQQRDEALKSVDRLTKAAQRMVVTAPRSGTVVLPPQFRGDKAKVGDSVWRLSTVLEIVSLDRMRATGEVAEVDVSRVGFGRTVTFRIDANPDVELSGRVTRMGDAFKAKPWPDPRKVVEIKIAIDDRRGLLLRPGMRFSGRIEVARVANALTIPLTAVVVDERGPYVYRRKGGRLQRVPIRIGQRARRSVQVREGLAVGDRVAIVGPRGLR